MICYNPKCDGYIEETKGCDITINGATVTQEELDLVRSGYAPNNWTYSDMMQVRRYLWEREGPGAVKYVTKTLTFPNYNRKKWLSEWKFVNSGTHADEIKMKPTLNQG